MIDSLGTDGSFNLSSRSDTFAVMENLDIFKRLIDLVARVDFDLDVNVSVFETNIRIVGGLLSAHILATVNLNDEEYPDDILLHKAIDVADRLLPAFRTPTGLPYGTVNLRHGVPKGETPIVCTACAGL